MKYEFDYSWSFHANQNRSLRHRLGSLLRRTADLLDRRISVALEISTTPQISVEDRDSCVLFGVRQMCRAVEESAKSAGIEHVLGYVMKETNGTPS